MLPDGRLIEDGDLFHVGLIVAAREDRGADRDPLAGEVDRGADDGYTGSHGDVVEARLPAIPSRPGSLRRDGQDEIVATRKLGRHRPDNVQGLGPVNRDAAEIAQGSGQGPSEQGGLAEEAEVQIQGFRAAEKADEIPVTGVRGPDQHEFRVRRSRPMNLPALHLEQQPQGQFHCVCKRCHSAVSVHSATPGKRSLAGCR